MPSNLFRRRSLLKGASILSASALGSGFTLGTGLRPAAAAPLPAEDYKSLDLEGAKLTLLANAAHGKSWSYISALFNKQTGGLM
jgi:hypothetical protein